MENQAQSTGTSSATKLGDFVSTLLDPNENSERPFQEFMEKTMIVEEDHDGREPGHERSVACIVYDGLMHFAQTVADRLKLPAICVRTSAAITLLIFAVIPRPQGDGYMSIQGM
ncbi:UDP-glucuronosyl/UDP-glucosyltransferase [Trema orientale]|uniref:UDP-glucuronosyl/UDP-glucosyltransferase n=1 Tax=Trema orientale TaxID=63057 RepID=A0A2P5EAH4_TREOI|nr:UDP-glucuronosyl/UDP-glucosyltransferase [Trema orientale]